MVVTDGMTSETAMMPSVLEEQLPQIQRALQERGFVPAGELADRHGAQQVTFISESDGLARLILLSEAAGTGEGDYRGSVDVVVQCGDQYARRRVISRSQRAEFERDLGDKAIETAVTMASSLDHNDLTDSFALRPRQTTATELLRSAAVG
jgi:hypothetical protein